MKNGTSSSSPSSGTFLAKLCAGYSFVAMLFLIFISILLETQPLYITGISVKKKSSSLSEEGMGMGEYPYDEENYKFRRETSNALKAAAAYFLLMVLSLSYIQAKEMNMDLMNYHTAIFGRVCHVRRLFVAAYCRYRRRHYDSIPDGNHPDDNDSHSGGGSVSILPMHHHHHTGETTQLLSSNSRQRKNRRSSPRNNQLDVEAGSSSCSGNTGNGGGGIGGGVAISAVEGVLGKFKSWGIGGGGGASSRTGRKKDK